MIFKENLDKSLPIIREAIDELISTALNNQTHPQDVLLVITHSFYCEPLFQSDQDINNPSNYAFGSSYIGLSENTHREFISWYFKNHQVYTEEFLNHLKNDAETKALENLSINIEKTIYLKFWESDMIIKYLYQLSLLCQRRNYDWCFEVPNHSRDGSKQEIIRLEIRDKLKSICPKFYDILRKTYSTQLRNAIAHSQYLIGNRLIRYLNYSDDHNAHCSIKTLKFEEWANYFDNTMLIYMTLINKFDTVKKKYYQKTIQNGFLETRITTKENKEIFTKIYLRKEHCSWTSHKRK